MIALIKFMLLVLANIVGIVVLFKAFFVSYESFVNEATNEQPSSAIAFPVDGLPEISWFGIKFWAFIIIVIASVCLQFWLFG